MQKVIDSVPLILLLSLVPYFFYNDPSVAHSIILVAISGLVGYRTYLDAQKKPDFLKLFTERLDAKDREVNEILGKFSKDVKEVKDGQNKLAIVQKNVEKATSYKW